MSSDKGVSAVIGWLILWFSSAQSPRSINLQRSLQNGRYLFSGSHTTVLRQVGQFTFSVMGYLCLKKMNNEKFRKNRYKSAVSIT
jgi:hypothetical protein